MLASCQALVQIPYAPLLSQFSLYGTPVALQASDDACACLPLHASHTAQR